ncbi:chromate efflux transporter [Dasania sp. GY-MA-18]|uniref:Chromate efflux transporter n=1 Tax=Dasania phycosphaerae TaxID=2950436 RepID=A0A9J6RNG0_9GAMM|nr:MULTISPECIES: chromate efflux transporter [Dasania]MCR8923247.1 chromate efflux transporter [Dasania sp. GY-MA-18]MCZ0865679.1 chromate efflux transporter [Dasania phycosphaerae]MCZ0869404.1 chromate efflux transporter [Dasania phycosphaerae]
MHNAKTYQTNTGSVLEVFLAFLKLGLTSFGGPIAHLAYFRTEFVERRRWLSEQQFAQLLAICQFLPGPASSQLGFSLGLLRVGWLGAIAAFVAFTLPSAILLLLFATALPFLSGTVALAALHGLKLVACAVVADAVLGMFSKLCVDLRRKLVALLAAVILMAASGVWLQLTVVVLAAIVGVLFFNNRDDSNNNSWSLVLCYGVNTGAVLLVLFLALLMALPIVATSNEGLYAVADVFYRAGALVFGGGHVVLPLLEDALVAPGKVLPEQFLAGYGASQAIPGPMFAFAAYLGALLSPVASPMLSAATALLFIFLPGFLLLAGVLPFWRAVSHNAVALRAIAAVNAAVVGMLGAALYDPILTSGITSVVDLAIVLIAIGLLIRWRVSPLLVVLWCVGLSVGQTYLHF